jgi:hypothetical protein
MHPDYHSYVGKSSQVTAESLNELRTDLYERRYYAYLMTPFEIPPVSLVTTYIPLCSFKSVPHKEQLSLANLVRPYSLGNPTVASTPSAQVPPVAIPFAQWNAFQNSLINATSNQSVVTIPVTSSSTVPSRTATSSHGTQEQLASPSSFMTIPAENIMPQLRVPNHQ